MYEHEDGRQGTPADERDARAQARRALQDAYDWRDDESRAPSSAPVNTAAATQTTAARAAARRSRREVITRSISRTVGV